MDQTLSALKDMSAGRVLGVHIVGDDACELLQYGMELEKSWRTIVDLTSCLYSAVTYVKIAAVNSIDKEGSR